MEPARRILVVEDDPAIVRLLEITFTAIGFQMNSTSSGREVRDLLAQVNPSVVILDITLPDTNGIDLISLIRERSDVPIIMLSAKTTDLEKVSSLNLGADDYVEKPFSVAELMARVQRLVARRGYGGAAEPEAKGGVGHPEPRGTVSFDIDQHRAFIGSREIHLTNKEFSLLHLLSTRGGKVVSKDTILDEVWGFESLDVESRAVDACVSRLRKKLKEVLPDDIIETVPGIGYRITAR